MSQPEVPHGEAVLAEVLPPVMVRGLGALAILVQGTEGVGHLLPPPLFVRVFGPG